MKATITFDLDDHFDRELHQQCLNASKYKSFIDDVFDKILRPIRKYGEHDGQNVIKVTGDDESKYYIELEYFIEEYYKLYEEIVD